MRKLKEHEICLNNLLAKEGVLNNLIPYESKKISLLPGTRYQAIVSTFDQILPFKMHIKFIDEPGLTYLYISELFERPNAKNCDEEYVLNKTNNVISYGKGRKEEKFMKKFLYVTFESTKSATMLFYHYFGKFEEKRKVDNQYFKLSKARLSYTNKEIDQLIMRLRKSPEEMLKLRQQVTEIIKKRKAKVMILSGQIETMKARKSLSSTNFIGCLKKITLVDRKCETHRLKRADTLRKRVEEKTALGKFIMVYKSDIEKMAVFLRMKLENYTNEKDRGK